MTELAYALAGVAPSPFPWRKIKVFDLDIGQEVLDVRECSATEGWLVSFKRNSLGKFYVDPETRQPAIQRVEGRFKIVLNDE